MVATGDIAPEFTAPFAYGDDDIGSFTLSEHLDEAPLVLAFFPGAFTTTCSHEMNAFQNRLSDFKNADASVYGVSVDSPFAQNAFRERLGLEYGLISDANHDIINTYEVAMEWGKYGLTEVAKRAVFIVNADREVAYSWVRDDTKTEPNYDEVLNAANAAKK